MKMVLKRQSNISRQWVFNKLKNLFKDFKFIKFAIVGIIGTIIDFGVMNLLVIVFKVPKLIAQAISFTLAVINNYFLNRIWTYPEARGKSVIRQFASFLVISVIGLGIRTPLFWGLSLGFTQLAQKLLVGSNQIKPEIVGNNIALAICIVVVLLWNYFANRKWTFNDKIVEKTDSI